MSVDPNENFIVEVNVELTNLFITHNNNPTPKSESKDATCGEILRDIVAIQMWTNYQNDLLV